MQYLSQLISCPLAHLFSLSKETFVKNPCLKQDYVIHHVIQHREAVLQ